MNKQHICNSNILPFLTAHTDAPSSPHTSTHLHQTTTYGHQTNHARRSPDNAVLHVLSHNTQLMSSASRLTRYKNVLFLKTFHCFIPERWTNQQAAGGASSSTGQVMKKVEEGKSRVGTPTGHHPLSQLDVVTAGHATGGGGARNWNCEQNQSCRKTSWKTQIFTTLKKMDR